MSISQKAESLKPKANSVKLKVESGKLKAEIPANGDVFGLYFIEKGRIAHVGFVDQWKDGWNLQGGEVYSIN